MTRESLSGIDGNLIFRETFNSYNDISRNGGTQTNVTIYNGIKSAEEIARIYNATKKGVR